MQINLPDPPLHEGFLVFGNVVSPTEFQGVLTNGLFKTIVPDPRRLEGHAAKYNTDLSGVAELRTQVQRLIAGAKRKNVDQYATYLIQNARTPEGFTPQIVLYCEQPLRVVVDDNTGFAWCLVPHELKFVAIDGDTQAAARNLADAQKPGLFKDEKVKIVIKHGSPVSAAEQIFADCNRLGVKVSTSMAIGLDSHDSATQLAKYVEQQVPVLKGSVNRQKRQLSAGDKDVITISALRAAVVCFVEGINGVQNQTKPISGLDGREGEWRDAAVTWFQAATDAVDGAMLPDQRKNTFASAPAVWCAIGALGHDAYKRIAGEKLDMSVTPAALEHAFQAEAKARLSGIDWSRGDHWLQVGAKKSSSGAVTLGGPKETGSLVYKAFAEGDKLSRHSPAAA